MILHWRIFGVVFGFCCCLFYFCFCRRCFLPSLFAFRTLVAWLKSNASTTAVGFGAVPSCSLCVVCMFLLLRSSDMLEFMMLTFCVMCLLWFDFFWLCLLCCLPALCASLVLMRVGEFCVLIISTPPHCVGGSRIMIGLLDIFTVRLGWVVIECDI